jgi:pseudouridine synthase
VVTKVGTIIDETKDVVTCDGAVVKPVQKKVYVAMNKPRMVMTTLSDPFRRKTIVHILKGVSERVYPIGRLDYDSEGILLLTNDGEMAYRLAHPRYGVRKVYEVRVSGEFGPTQAKKIQQGIKLEDGAIGRAQQVTVISASEGETRVRMTLTEGRKREVKQLCKAVGTPVKHLKRIEFAGITQRDLPPGKWRYLSQAEIDFLCRKVGLDEETPREPASA